MKKKWLWLSVSLVVLILIGLGMIQPFPTKAGGPGTISPAQSLSAYDYTDQLIVKYRNSSFVKNAVLNVKNAEPAINARVNALSAKAGVTMRHYRFMSGDGHVLKLPNRMTLAEAELIAQRLNSDPNVEYAEPDARMYPLLAPNDPQYANQWHYKAPATEIGGANLPGAWDKTIGSSSIVAAVIDTGIVTHADLAGRTVAGYNFISDAWSAGNGVGRSADPSDLGDWVEANDCGVGKPAEDSSWHGTHVAGTIGAATNNSVGVAGINWISKILPVRVLGKCGGTLSDIADGMRWAAGLSVTGVPANANPAKVLNLSLGGTGACGTTYQDAITAITAAGATVVISAGNSNADTVGYRPANCTGVISVASTGRTGGRASYSNYGTIVKIAAPGGNMSSGTTNGVLSTLNIGATSPVASPGGDTYEYYQGTSMAAPHVTGIVSLMLSTKPTMTPAQVLARLQSTARTFPTGTGSDCTTSLCGAGIIDATAAVEAFSTPAINGLDPMTATALGAGFPLTVTGSSFSPTAVVNWDGHGLTTTYVSDTQLTADVPAALIVTGAIIPVTVVNPGSLPSNALNFTLNNPEPAISSLSPGSVAPASGAFTLTVNGSKFVSSSVVNWNGSPRATTFVSATQLTAAITATDVLTLATINITVFNPTPGGGTSNTVTFSVAVPVPGGGGGCFIATAAFGTPLEKHVQILRDFRDRFLLTTSAGQAFVKFYYEVSPPIAGKIAQSEGLRFITRGSLMPFVGMAYLVVTYGVTATLLLALSLMLMLGAVVWIIRRKMMMVNP
jgi:serine protease